jgi:hypothetical protein
MKALTELALAALLAARTFVRKRLLPNPSEEWVEPQCQPQS